MERVRSKSNDSLSEKNVEVTRENVSLKSNQWIATDIMWWEPAALRLPFEHVQAKAALNLSLSLLRMHSETRDFRV
jgi:hypothetical protein